VLHAVPHAPQCVPSAVRSTHVLPHNVRPALHWHAPAWHVWPAPQVVPQAPQLLESVFESTQPAAQPSRPPWHVHWPFTQLCEAPQVLPHVPQLPLSLDRLTHWVVHWLSPAGQPVLPPVPAVCAPAEPDAPPLVKLPPEEIPPLEPPPKELPPKEPPPGELPAGVVPPGEPIDPPCAVPPTAALPAMDTPGSSVALWQPPTIIDAPKSATQRVTRNRRRMICSLAPRKPTCPSKRLARSPP
jgi:hypothetical protein